MALPAHGNSQQVAPAWTRRRVQNQDPAQHSSHARLCRLKVHGLCRLVQDFGLFLRAGANFASGSPSQASTVLIKLSAAVPFALAVMTATNLANNASSCITQPGCGFSKDGTATACRKGTYSSGNHRQPCTSCPGSLTTVAGGAESVSTCMAPPGFFFQVGRQAAQATAL